MSEVRRVRGGEQYYVTGAQLGALAVIGLMLSGLAFFVGVLYGRQEVELVDRSEEHDVFIDPMVEGDALAELLARLEQAAAPTAEAAPLRFDDALGGSDGMPVPAERGPSDGSAAAEPPLEAPAAPEGAQVVMAGWGIQVASYATAEEADARRAALEGEGVVAIVVAALVKGETWYRVRVGPYPSEEEAREGLASLASQPGSESYIITRMDR